MITSTSCPCCRQPWPLAPSGKLPVWVLRQLAFDYVTRATALALDDIRGTGRQAELVEARALLVWIAKTFGRDSLSYPQIARWVGRDHTSVMHLWKKVIPRLLVDSPDFAGLCGGFRARAVRALAMPMEERSHAEA